MEVTAMSTDNMPIMTTIITHVPPCLCSCTCADVHMYKGRKDSLSCTLDTVLASETGSLTGLTFAKQTGLAGQSPKGPPVSASPALRLHIMPLGLALLTWV